MVRNVPPSATLRAISTIALSTSTTETRQWEKVRIGLIGLGFMGSTYFRIYESMANAEVVALAEVDPAKRRGDISKVIGNIGDADNRIPLELSGVKVYEDVLELVRDPAVEVVDICVPTEFHASYILAALAAGKHVHSEKPLCRTRAEADAIRAAVAQARSCFSVGLCVRCWPPSAMTAPSPSR